MKLSSKGQYAITAMMELAVHDRSRPVTLSEISLAQSISLSYLEQLFARLRAKELVEGVRGPGGGYRLAKSPKEISIADVILAVDQQDVLPIEIDSPADIQNLWSILSQRLFQFLDEITLDQFVHQPEIKEFAALQNDESRRMNFMMPPPESLS